MKKIIALAIAIVMMAALAVPAFAAWTDDRSSTTVNYSVGESYTITVPASVSVDGEAGTITAAEVNLLANRQVTVTVASDCKFGDVENAFAVKVNDGDTLTVNFDAADETATVKAVSAANTPTEAGTYTGSITYTAEITNVQ